MAKAQRYTLGVVNIQISLGTVEKTSQANCLITGLECSQGLQTLKDKHTFL